MQEKLGKATDQNYEIDTTAIQKVINDKKTTAREKAVIQHAFAGAIWTRVDLHKAGYEVSSTMCPLCQAKPDTLKHRIWECMAPEAQEQRDKIDPEIVKAAREMHEEQCCRLHLKAPGHNHPGPLRHQWQAHARWEIFKSTGGAEGDQEEKIRDIKKLSHLWTTTQDITTNHSHYRQVRLEKLKSHGHYR